MATTKDAGEIEPQPLADDVFRKLAGEELERFKFHRNSAQGLGSRYRRLGWFFSLFIPLASIAITGLAGLTKNAASASVVGVEATTLLMYLGAAVAIAAALNARLKPEEQYLHYTEILIRLEDWRSDFQISLSGLRTLTTEQKVSLLEAKHNEITLIGKAMAQKYIPPMPPS